MKFLFQTAILAALIAPASAQEIMVGDITLRFECKQDVSPYDRPPGASQSATATATIPPDGGWVMTGGGCERPENFTAVDMYSKPTDDGKGWTCQTFDFPGVRLNSAVRAYVRYCRIAAR